MKLYKPRHTNIPNADVDARTTAKTGMTGAFRMSPRRTAPKGAASSIASTGRHSCFGLDVMSCWKSPSQGERRNHAIISGINAASMRGRKDRPASPWVVKPMTVTMAIARTSPGINSCFDFIMFMNSSAIRKRQVRTQQLTPPPQRQASCADSLHHLPQRDRR